MTFEWPDEIDEGNDRLVPEERLVLRLLGGFEARRGAEPPIAFPTRKAKALLAILTLCPGEPYSREKLADLLWGNSAEEQARSSLRQTLALLRKALSHSRFPTVMSEGDELFLDPDNVEVDVVAFERLRDEATPEALENAVGIYRGELLDGLDLKEDGFAESGLRPNGRACMSVRRKP